MTTLATLEQAQALKEIRDRHLYLESHPTFEDYCLKRFCFNAATVGLIMAVADGQPIGRLAECEAIIDIAQRRLAAEGETFESWLDKMEAGQ